MRTINELKDEGITNSMSALGSLGKNAYAENSYNIYKNVELL